MTNTLFNILHFLTGPVRAGMIMLVVFSIVQFLSCDEKKSQIVKVAGTAQGTTYHITYISAANIDYKTELDSILKKIDSSLSTYLPVSIISRINNNDSNVVVDKYFTDVFEEALRISAKTAGLFDVTVAPLVNTYGFGFTKKGLIDSSSIDSLLQFVGYEMVKIENGKVIKAKPQVMLDFNAIAQGYTVDVLATFLETKKIENYLVELGGEVKAKGKKNKNEFWKIGIDKPNENPGEGRLLQAVVDLRDKALATSGNYRKFYVENGKKYAHIIDPRTGYPVKHNLLSATVIADNCMTADAYATAFMVMGLERSRQFLSTHQEIQLEVYFIFEENGKWKTFNSATLNDWIEHVH
ncbi:MAG TPA: FAD:protein FMN transferase [Flavitalea sp.]|nr:FAD:protein FMN transferase [Flavitalea sp.]